MSHADEGTLHAYLDGELTPVEVTGLEQHLAACAPCRGRLEEARALIARAQRLLAQAEPPTEATAPRRVPAAAGSRMARPLPRWLPLAWAASVLLALGGGWLAHGGRPRTAGDAVSSLTDQTRQSVPDEQAAAPTPQTAPTAGRQDAPARGAANDAVGRQSAAASPAVAAKAEERDVAELLASADAAPAPAAPVQPRSTPDVAAALVAGAAANATELGALETARRQLGGTVYAIPGLPLVAVHAADSATVIVEQRLGTGVLRLTERQVSGDEGRGGAAPQAAARERGTGRERLARYLGTLRIEIEGAAPTDSLSRLLDRLQPIE